jgi:polysaccharide pyruvyl transferase WcaK-like protein
MLFIKYFFVCPKCDLVIHLGTDGYSDIHLPSRILSWLSVVSHSYQLLLGRIWGKPVIAASMTIGPFERPSSRWMARTAMNNVDFLTVREEKSFQYLKQLGIKSPVYLVSDLAFLMDGVDQDKVKEVLVRDKIPTEARLAVVAPNLLHWQISSPNYGKTEQNPYVKVMADVVDYLHDRGLHVILVAQTTGYKHSDMETCLQIQKLSQVNPPIIDNTQHTPQEVKGIMQACDIVVSSKLHAAIFAISAGTPTISIASQYKINAIIGDVLGLHDSIVHFTPTDPANIWNRKCQKSGRCL